MESGEMFTSIEDMQAEAKARQEKQRAEEAQLGGPKPTVTDVRTAKKAGEVHFKAQHGIVVAFFSFILVLHVLGTYLFTTGFLLTRLVLPHKSECAVPPIELTKGYVAGDAEKGCWHPKTYNKAIVVIVDALRYDFTVPFDAQFEPVDLAKQADHAEAASSEKNVAPRHFHNAIPVLYETAKQSPKNAFLLPFIADPPTTTLQRLKGLTTGTLPTFVDAGSNFAGTAIDEDNLVAQLKDAGKRVVHLGDDTWHALFPGYFEANLTHAYDSFNVWDLHTVDNGVTEHIFPLLKGENSTKWDVIFGHYLGVDHAGHRYGPDHPAMAAKLSEMDAVFRRMIEELDDDTLLVVMGDHGMDAKGDHGGESDDEIQAALWMYSKKSDFGRTDPFFALPPAHAKDRSVAQIDLVPTLSLLLGLPIPFNNLGKPIDEAFAGVKGGDFENLATVNRLTSAQIHRYQGEYANVRGLDESVFSSSLSLWPAANEAWTSVFQRMSFGGNTAKGEQMKAAYKAFAAYQEENLRICRSLWARFDVPRMINGVLILALSVLLIALYARGLVGDRAEITPVFFTRGLLGSVLGAVLGFVASIVLPDTTKMHTVPFAAAMTGIVGVLSAFYSFRNRLSSLLPNNIWGWASLFFTVSLSGGFAANSFTIWEDEILLHFLTTFGVIAIVSSFRQKNMSDRTLGVYHSILFTVLLRVASFSRLCREEQMPYCKSTYYASALSTTSAPWQLLIPAIAALLVPTFIKSYYEGTKSYQNMAVMWIGIVLRFGLMLSAAYWALDAADDADWYPSFSSIIKISKQALAQGVLLLAFGIGYGLYSWSKPLLNIEMNNEGKPNEQIIVHGYANVHGSRYALLITIWYLAVALLQKPMGAGAIGILVWQLFSLFEIIDTNNLRQSSIGPVVLGLLGSFHYFKTGHQATLSSIQWESAFIPLKSIRYPWTPIVVILNTFGAQILCAVAVPALVLWKVNPKQKRLLSTVAKAVATHILFYAVVSLATTMWAGHLRRHLMLYRIFSPRWMLGASVLLVVDVVAIFVGLWGARMSIISVAEVFGFA
ncbi:mannose-ethanolamine phosphotransferase gpi13 [Didymella pomorum]|uniref:Mannose-ethanolamine phosphotransferase gpi13 n=1 Tax=Didymella pomorum TaxID=749634 RepID=A0A9W9D411_9PLEO|nr:mannose-ethanolamine phosphotransferase gpi13 [Didymella pomorum]